MGKCHLYSKENCNSEHCADQMDLFGSQKIKISDYNDLVNMYKIKNEGIIVGCYFNQYGWNNAIEYAIKEGFTKKSLTEIREETRKKIKK